MVVLRQRGNFNNLSKFLNKCRSINIDKILEKYARKGLEALQNATPNDTGKTARSWGYAIEKNQNGVVISWTNSNIVDGVPIAIIIQYGHATRNGGYVTGIDYINPALKPVFDELSEKIFKEVTSA